MLSFILKLWKVFLPLNQGHVRRIQVSVYHSVLMPLPLTECLYCVMWFSLLVNLSCHLRLHFYHLYTHHLTQNHCIVLTVLSELLNLTWKKTNPYKSFISPQQNGKHKYSAKPKHYIQPFCFSSERTWRDEIVAPHTGFCRRTLPPNELRFKQRLDQCTKNE